jgi:hypothetical protein
MFYIRTTPKLEKERHFRKKYLRIVRRLEFLRLLDKKIWFQWTNWNKNLFIVIIYVIKIESERKHSEATKTRTKVN